MTVEGAWSNVDAELALWAIAGQTARFWLRDDDTEASSAALDRLLGLFDLYAAPCLLAVIPMRAQAGLKTLLSGNHRVAIAMHGVWHTNHQPQGTKAAETPPARGLGVIAQELAAARHRLIDLFGPEAGTWYVPPWNRISDEAVALLPDLGFMALSAFGTTQFPGGSGLQQHNTHIDIVDWKNGRVGHDTVAVAGDLSAALAVARLDGFRPVGILTHHLVHDETAWSVLHAMMRFVHNHPAASFLSPGELLQLPRLSGRVSGSTSRP
ncbi:MAG: polysaccharide deacetylase [Beijerinckiaceae bacterium]